MLGKGNRECDLPYKEVIRASGPEDHDQPTTCSARVPEAFGGALISRFDV